MLKHDYEQDITLYQPATLYGSQVFLMEYRSQATQLRSLSLLQFTREDRSQWWKKELAVIPLQEPFETELLSCFEYISSLAFIAKR